MRVAMQVWAAVSLLFVLVAGATMLLDEPPTCPTIEPWQESYTSMQALWDRCGAQGGVFTWQWLPDQLEVHAGCIGGVR